MNLRSLKTIGNRLWQKFRGNPDRFLKHVSGVVHVGANTGQERESYAKFGLRVIWLEPIPRIFAKLQTNLRPFPDQRAIQCLITDRDDEERQFHIANNDGASSSILDLKEHKDVWPDANYTETIVLKTTTLNSLFAKEGIDPGDYQALVMDTQGSELLVLKGGIPLLRGFKYIKTEVPDFEAYAGCCQLSDIAAFMREHGYAELSRKKFASRSHGGSYFDVVYQKTDALLK